MATNQILTRQSGEEEIRRYFNAVLQLSASENEFPVNFEEVWMLVYKDKHKAVNELKEKFIENIDFQAVTQKVECKNGFGCSRRTDYFLTVSCLEFFIARKVREVFEVYRQVFHRKTNIHQISRKELARMIYESELENERLQSALRRQEQKILELKQRIENGENLPERVTKLEQLVIPGFCHLPEGTQPQKKEVIGGRIKPSISKTRYPGALLVNDMRSRMLLENGINVRSRDIFRWLLREGWILQTESVHNMPSELSVNNGWILPAWGTGRKDSDKTFYTPRFTEKGYRHFLELIMQKGGIL